METRKRRKEVVTRLIALLSLIAILLVMGCQGDRRIGKERQEQQAGPGRKPEARSEPERAVPVETARAIAVFEKLGGSLQVDEQEPGEPVVIIDLSFREATDAELARLKTFTRLEELYLIETKITDAGLANLCGLANLHTLDLGRTPITDKGIVRLEGLSNLRTLGLSSTKITDAAVGQLKRLAGLQVLDLSNTKITAAGVKEIRQALPNVQVLR